MTKRVRRSNVKDGVLLPLGNGFSLVKGNHPNKVDDVDIGPNNKNGLSVNHGEILQQNGNELRVFSAEPMLGGVSPVQLLYGGMAPDKVFAMQEQYKQANRIADDGSKYKDGGKKANPRKEIDWSDIVTTNNRPYNKDYINYINKSLINSGYNNNQRASILANIIEESGGNPFAEGPGGYYGLLQWGSERYSKGKETDAYKEIDNQLKYLNDTIGNTKDKKSWTHGGKGSGYNSFSDAMNAYNSDDLNKVMHGFTWGYVRPAGKQNSYLNRQKVADQLINKEGFKFGGIYIKPSKRGTFTAAAKQHGMSVQGFASKVLANKENYSSAMVKKANFAKNASKWNHLYGGENILINSLGERPNAKFGKQMKNKRIKAIRGYDGDKDNILNPSIITASGRKVNLRNRQLVNGPKIGLTVPDIPLQENLEGTTITASGKPLSSIDLTSRVVSPKQNLTIPEIVRQETLSPLTISAKGKPLSSVNLTGRVNGPTTGINVPGLPQYETLAPVTVTASGRPLSSVNLPSQVTTPTIGPRNPFNVPKAISSNPNFANPVTDKYGLTTGVNGNVTSIKTPDIGPKVPEVTPKTSKSSGLSALGADLIGAGINAAGSLIAAGINQKAIDDQKFTPRQYNLLNPVKLKTKINIDPQLSQMRESVAKVSDAARRTSASSRNAYQKIANARLTGLNSMMGLYGDKENKETQLINQDRLNQQQIATQNSNRVMETVNYNITGKDALANRKAMLTAQNWINPVNVIAGTVAGPQGLLARRDARRNNAANLAMMSLAYPDAARMIMSGDGWQKAFNGYYDMLNNKVRV